MAGILFLISAPSGSGKSTLVNQLKTNVTGLDFSVSYTTREPRGSEQPGREYHYIDRATFERMRENGEFLECADVFGNYYGTACHSLQDARAHHHDLLLDIDVQGASQVRRKVPDAVTIFVMPPSPQALETRLRNRSRAEGTISEEVIARRLAKARVEIENYEEYGYILVNDVLDRAVEELVAIVTGERFRRGQIEGRVPDLDRLLAIADQCRRQNAAERIRPVLAAFGIPEPARTR